MVPVIIELDDTISEFMLSPSEAKSLSDFVLDTVVTEFSDLWMDTIDEELKSTRKEYKAGIFQDNPDDDTIIIGLTPRQSQLAMMLEEGANPFDMKEGFSKSSKKHIKKDGGWYMNIPFRWATSEAVAESASFANKMPKPIEALVKKLPAGETLSISAIEKQAGKFAGTGQNPTTGYKHKFNIYEGLGRQEIGSGANEKRGGYMTFRRVSDKSDPLSWFHSGFEAKHLMQKALDKMDISAVVDKAVDDYLSSR